MKKTDRGHRRLLRPRRKRPYCSANKLDELASLHVPRPSLGDGILAVQEPSPQCTPNVRFGSFADMAAGPRNICSTPENGHWTPDNALRAAALFQLRLPILALVRRRSGIAR
jgi:hypothetical protein